VRACIHRGTREIGGTCIEVESQGKRIVLDIGIPLDVADPDQFDLYPVNGFQQPDPSLLGVIISHPHQDHYGLAYRLPKETLFLIGKAAQNILAASKLLSLAGTTFQNVLHLEDRRPIVLGPFTITPFLVDHSAYDAYAVLVESEGKRLFHTGDLRAHGRKGSLFEKLLRLPPANVDVLLMEGTTIGRADQGFPTETQLEARFIELFHQTTGMPLVCCSSQNIDRLVTVVRACIRSQRTFIIDMYTAHVLRATGNKRLAQAHWDCIKVFLPTSQKLRIITEKAFEVSQSYRAWRIYPRELATATSRSVMLFRASMIQDLEKAKCLAGARLIYSLWSGYLAQERNKQLVEWAQSRGIPLVHCHTSGHAAVQDLKRLRQAFPEAVVVPIHTDQPDQFSTVFGNVQLRQDGEWWCIE
jgi:ribonuclease J